MLFALFVWLLDEDEVPLALVLGFVSLFAFLFDEAPLFADEGDGDEGDGDEAFDDDGILPLLLLTPLAALDEDFLPPSPTHSSHVQSVDTRARHMHNVADLREGCQR